MGKFMSLEEQCDGDDASEAEGVCAAMNGCIEGCGENGSYECGKSCWDEYVEGNTYTFEDV